MTNKPTKLLSILASTLVLTGFTADTAFNSAPTVSAATHHKKKHTKKKQKHHTKQKATKNKQTTNNTNSNANNNVNNDNNATNYQASNSSDYTIEPQSNYSSLADWYAANAVKIYNKYHDSSSDDSQEFSRGYSDGVFGVINDTTQYNNEFYKQGQILGMTFNDVDPTAAITSLPAQYGVTLSQLMQQSIDSYNAAGSYIQANPSVKYIQITGPNNQWGPNQ